MESFLDLLEIHKLLDASFEEHQCLLLHFDFDHAGKTLRNYQARLLAHMNDEESLLLPLYEERATIEKGGEARLFIDEHEKMRNFVALFIETVDGLRNEAHPERTLLKLLDREFFYLRLCSHHDIRETKYLYPALDEVTTPLERQKLLECKIN